MGQPPARERARRRRSLALRRSEEHARPAPACLPDARRRPCGGDRIRRPAPAGRRIAGRGGRRAAADRTGARRGHARRVRRIGRRHAPPDARHARLRAAAQAVRRADRELPGAAAPAGRHAHGAGTGRGAHGQRRRSHRRRLARRTRTRRLVRQGGRRQGLQGGRAGGGAAAWRHGHDRRAGSGPLRAPRHAHRGPVRTAFVAPAPRRGAARRGGAGVAHSSRSTLRRQGGGAKMPPHTGDRPWQVHCKAFG